jgi:hypothetical protein
MSSNTPPVAPRNRFLPTSTPAVSLHRLRKHLEDCQACYDMRPLDCPGSDAEDVREPSRNLCIRGRALLALWEAAKAAIHQ